MKRPFILLVIILLSVTSLGAQSLIFKIQGTVKDIISDTLIHGARVQLIRSDGKEFNTLTNKNGFYHFGTDIVLAQLDYTILIDSKDHLASTGKESTKKLKTSTAFVHDFEIQSCCIGPVHFPGIPFDSVRSKSNETFVKLLQVMNKNPTIVIEITEKRDSTNRVNLFKYSNIVYQNLLESGVNPKRIRLADEVIYPRDLGLEEPNLNVVGFEVLRDDFEE